MRIDLRPQRPQLSFGDLTPQSLLSVLSVSFLLLELQRFEPAADLPGDGAHEADFAVEQMAAPRARSYGEDMGRFSFHPHRSEEFNAAAELPFHLGGATAECYTDHQEFAAGVQLPSHWIIEAQFTNFAAVEGRR